MLRTTISVFDRPAGPLDKLIAVAGGQLLIEYLQGTCKTTQAHLWEKALDRLRRRKVNCAPWETPSALIERLRVEQPDIVDAFSAVAQAYLNTRYGQRPEDLKNLRRAVAQLP